MEPGGLCKKVIYQLLYLEYEFVVIIWSLGEVEIWIEKLAFIYHIMLFLYSLNNIHINTAQETYT